MTYSRLVPLLLLALLLPGCMPLVSHGPRVEPGMWSGSTSGFGLGPGLEGEVETLLGDQSVRTSNGFYGRYGWVDREGLLPGFQVGVHLPFLLPLSVLHPELDLYGQYTGQESVVQAGSGLLASPSYLMPYAQLGGDVSSRSELYTTQGLAVFGYRGGAPEALLWMPSLTWRRRDAPDPERPEARRGATNYSLQLAVGREETETGDRTVRRIIFGIAREDPGFFDLFGAGGGGSPR